MCCGFGDCCNCYGHDCCDGSQSYLAVAEIGEREFRDCEGACGPEGLNSVCGDDAEHIVICAANPEEYSRGKAAGCSSEQKRKLSEEAL